MALVVRSLQDPCTLGTKKCNLCLTEKSASMKADPGSLLNTLNKFLDPGA